jgi:hypothetical protein
MEDKKLEKMIYNFHNKLSIAQEARREIMYYLENHYEIDETYEVAMEIQDELNWCYGINSEHVDRLIRKVKEGR